MIAGRRWRIAARVLGMLGLPVTLLLSLSFLLAFVPMWSNVALEVENRSGRALAVTPIGFEDPGGPRALLPIRLSRSLNLPALTSRGFEMAPGERLRLFHLGDEFRLSGFVVVPASGPARELVAADAGAHSIPELGWLPLARPESLALLDQSLAGWWHVAFVLVGLLAPVLLSWSGIRSWRRLES